MGRCYREKNRTRHFDRDKHLCVVKSSCVVMSFLGGYQQNQDMPCVFTLGCVCFVGGWVVFVVCNKRGGVVGGFWGGQCEASKVNCHARAVCFAVVDYKSPKQGLNLSRS